MSPHPGTAITQFIQMRDKAKEIADGYFQEYGGAAVGELVYDEDHQQHYIAATGLVTDIEMAKTHVWEDGRVEEVF